MKKIYCVFSVDNNYDQPENNLVIAWLEKPDLPEFSSAFGLPTDVKQMSVYDAIERFGELMQKISSVYRGNREKISSVEYRFEEIEEGKLLKQS